MIGTKRRHHVNPRSALSGGAESDHVQALALSAQKLIDLFTGGDRDIEARLDAGYDKSQISAEENWGVSPKVFDFAASKKVFRCW